MTAPLQANGIVRRFGGLTAVDDVDLSAPAGAITAIIGPNGAGKSTLFGCLAGQLPVDSGQVLLDGHDVSRLSADGRARRGLARTFQRLAVFPSLTVEENVLVGVENRSRRGLLGRGAVHRSDVAEVIEALGLESARQTLTAELPTGTLRLVELASALSGRPRVMLLDEPSSGLDDEQVARFSAVVRRVAGHDRAVVLIEHDLSLVFAVADVVHVLMAGRIVASGSPEEIRADPAVRAAYLAGPT